MTTTIQLKGRDIDGDCVTCTIAQLLLILGELESACGQSSLVWYGDQMDPALGQLSRFGTLSPLKIGAISDVQSLLRSLSYPQIDFGLFIAISADAVAPASDTTLSVQGPSGQRHAGSVIELLAFDDTYVEVTTERDDVVRGLMARFPGGKILGS
jgi:hypothetical protein